MITTKQIEISKIDDLSSEYIEAELQKLDIVPLRWAIVEVMAEKYVLSVSYETSDY